MIVLLAILQNALQAVVDVMDKFLISKRKIEPVSYTFFTVVTGILVILFWPWIFVHLPAKAILFDLFVGAFYSLTLYAFFKALAGGEVTRVIPFIFGLVPLFDILLSWITGRNSLLLPEVAAMFLLVPGALLISFRPGKTVRRHLLIKLLAALLFSIYNFLWQYGASTGSVMNHFMWDRIGAAGILLVLLAFPGFRKKVLAFSHIPQKAHTSFLFVFKQVLGGVNFIFISLLLALGNVVVIDSLLGFRYAFLFIFSVILSYKFKKVLDEEVGKRVILQKIAAIILIFLGTIFLFIR